MKKEKLLQKYMMTRSREMGSLFSSLVLIFQCSYLVPNNSELTQSVNDSFAVFPLSFPSPSKSNTSDSQSSGYLLNYKGDNLDTVRISKLQEIFSHLVILKVKKLKPPKDKWFSQRWVATELGIELRSLNSQFGALSIKW